MQKVPNNFHVARILPYGANKLSPVKYLGYSHHIVWIRNVIRTSLVPKDVVTVGFGREKLVSIYSVVDYLRIPKTSPAQGISDPLRRGCVGNRVSHCFNDLAVYILVVFSPRITRPIQAMPNRDAGDSWQGKQCATVVANNVCNFWVMHYFDVKLWQVLNHCLRNPANATIIGVGRGLGVIRVDVYSYHRLFLPFHQSIVLRIPSWIEILGDHPRPSFAAELFIQTNPRGSSFSVCGKQCEFITL